MAKKSKYKELIVNIGIFSVATLLSKAVMFFLLPLYTNVLSTAEYGIIELITTGINLLTPVLTLSVSDAVVRFGLDSSVPHEKVLKAETIVFLCSSVLAFACYPLIILYEPLRQYAFLSIITLIALMVRSNYSFYLKSIDNNKLFAIDSVIYTIILAGSNILYLVGFKMGIVGYLLSLITANVFSILFVLFFGKGFRALIIGKFDAKLLRNMLLYSSPMIFNALSWWITNSSDKYMLEYYWSSSEVGLYSAAAKIPALLTTVNALFAQAWTLSSVREYERAADKSFFKNVFSTYCTLIFLSAALIICITKPFMQIYVGKDFVEAWYYVPALLIAALFGCFSNYFGSIYIAAKQNIRCTVSTIICGLINIALNFLLIPKFGIWGATIATAISFVVVGVYRMIDCQHLFHFPIDYTKFFGAAILVILESWVVIQTNLKHLLPLSMILLIALLYWKEIKSLCGLALAKIIKKRSE